MQRSKRCFLVGRHTAFLGCRAKGSCGPCAVNTCPLPCPVRFLVRGHLRQVHCLSELQGPCQDAMVSSEEQTEATSWWTSFPSMSVPFGGSRVSWSPPSVSSARAGSVLGTGDSVWRGLGWALGAGETDVGAAGTVSAPGSVKGVEQA